MNKLAIFASFVLGAAAGSVVTWKLVKDKYAAIAQEEIDSVKEYFKPNEDIPQTELAKKSVNKPSINDYAKFLAETGYTDYADLTVEDVRERFGYDKKDAEPEDDHIFKEKPYVISPDEFGELEVDGYENISLTYYADHILAEDNGEPVEDVEDIVGFESLTHFGEYEDDSVFVRNDRLKCDYEILLDTRKYDEVIKTKPRPRELC